LTDGGGRDRLHGANHPTELLGCAELAARGPLASHFALPPIPAGMFKPDARGSATVVEPPLPGGVEAKAFAITVEPEQGSSAPTMPIVMMGAGE